MGLLQEFSISLERRVRGWREYQQHRDSDSVVVSYGKSGRTWLRVMISRYCQLKYELPDDLLLEFDNFQRINPAAPRIFFTHDNYLRSYTGNRDTKLDYYHKNTLLLVRQPQDVAVSQFFQWKYRMRKRKKVINRYPPHDADISLLEFVHDPGQGLPNVIRYMNDWARDTESLQSFRLTRYEDLRSQPEQEMERIIDFLGLEPRSEWIADCVQFASLENLRTKERANHFRGSRLQAGDPDNPDSYKVRRAKVGGYKDYFSDQEVAELDAMVNRDLSPLFGYRAEDPAN
ncbi:MAG: sulfotransferase domain-containing protein [Gammaproteobacteria bacterium]|nr:sulfotransferase domain-containing protein [Gammaproteobacteria bacterium]